MASKADISLTDAAATPVVQVYKPATASGQLITFIDRTATAVSMGQNRLTVYQRPADKTTQATKFAWKLEVPILAQASGGTSSGYVAEPKVSHTLIGTIEFVLPAKSVLQERKDLLSQLRDLIDEAIVTNQVHDYEPLY